jgi:hypothetical protein
MNGKLASLPMRTWQCIGKIFSITEPAERALAYHCRAPWSNPVDPHTVFSVHLIL